MTSSKVTRPSIVAAPRIVTTSASPDVPGAPLSSGVASSTSGRPMSSGGRSYVRVSIVLDPSKTMLAHGSLSSRPNNTSGSANGLVMMTNATRPGFAWRSGQWRGGEKVFRLQRGAVRLRFHPLFSQPPGTPTKVSGPFRAPARTPQPPAEVCCETLRTCSSRGPCSPRR